MPTTRNTGYPREWWYQKPGEPITYYTAAEVREDELRAAKGGDLLTDEPIGPGAPTTLTVIGKVRQGEKRCRECSATFPVRIGSTATICPVCREQKRRTA